MAGAELLRAYGYFLRLAQRILGNGLSEMEYKNYCSNPGVYFSGLVRKVGLKKLDEKENEQLIMIMNLIDHEQFKDEFLSESDQGRLLLAFWQYDSEWMTRAEAAEEIGLSVQSIDKYFKNGKLHGFKDPNNGSIKIFRSSVLANKK